jgi:SpoVK/Ycf46/Vps4 family AAA+-type ATPase
MTPQNERAGPVWLAARVERLERLLAGKSVDAAPAPAGELALLADRCGLDALDLDILMLAVAAELRAVDVDGEAPTVGRAAELFGSDLATRLAVRRRFDADGPLRRFDLVVLRDFDEAAEDASLAESGYLAASRVIDLLLGRDAMDSYIRLYARLSSPTVTWDELRMPRARVTALRSLLSSGGPDRRSPLLLLPCGPGGSGRLALAEAAAADLGKRVLVVNARLLCTEGPHFRRYVRRILREAVLQGAMPIFVEATPFRPGEDFDWDGFSLLMGALSAFSEPAAICLDRPLEFDIFPADKWVVRADLEPIQAPHRQELWSAALPDTEIDLWHFAKLFNFGGGGIREMVREATNKAVTERGPDARVAHDDLMYSGREIQSRRMGSYTRKMTPRVSLDDLVAPDRVKGTLREIIHTIQYRHIVFKDWGFGEKISTGKGLCALFSGPPGTGKSMAAQVIARELGMNLFRVNLARVVSKYIGETEENLAKVFEEAGESHSILLFDEADALFAKRTKVKSAQDRYANLEVNFLLQEVETFEGMVVLTSNLESMIDTAFKRRLNYRVYFPPPDAAGRAQIWRKHIPSKAPIADGVDYLALAEDFDVTGGYIKNAVVRAAQWAAEGEGLITQEMLAKAAEVEMAETGRLVRQSD